MKRCWRSRIVFIGRTRMSPGLRSIGSLSARMRRVAVVGAHLSGQPLNWQLTDAARALVEDVPKRLPCYRFYALPGHAAAQARVGARGRIQGPGIEVEVWAVPENQFGSFVAAVPPPLGIGSATLEDGETVKCFICEPYALRDATEITQFGGWRALSCAVNRCRRVYNRN